jgi:hypothetical protein
MQDVQHTASGYPPCISPYWLMVCLSAAIDESLGRAPALRQSGSRPSSGGEIAEQVGYHRAGSTCNVNSQHCNAGFTQKVHTISRRRLTRCTQITIILARKGYTEREGVRTQ